MSQLAPPNAMTADGEGAVGKLLAARTAVKEEARQARRKRVKRLKAIEEERCLAAPGQQYPSRSRFPTRWQTSGAALAGRLQTCKRLGIRRTHMIVSRMR